MGLESAHGPKRKIQIFLRASATGQKPTWLAGSNCRLAVEQTCNSFPLLLAPTSFRARAQLKGGFPKLPYHLGATETKGLGHILATSQFFLPFDFQRHFGFGVDNQAPSLHG